MRLDGESHESRRRAAWLPGGEEAYKRENEEFERQLGAAAKILGIKTPTNSATR
ncbi:MAG: hypothetical protein IIT98_02615 [Kiritimatiellae bacterium]|nr:hypothetical protein [Kiritimatiellia bacterium]